MNMPNQLTVARLVATALFVIVLATEIPGRFWWASSIFAVAAFTDFLDGWLARRLHLVTDFGKLIDPLADKVLMTAGFVCLIPIGLVPAWVAVVILTREFLVTGLRTLAAGKGIVLAAERLGKWKTVMQIVTILYLLVGSASGWDIGNVAQAWSLGGHVLLGLATMLTVVSGLGYCWNNRHLFSENDAL